MGRENGPESAVRSLAGVVEAQPNGGLGSALLHYAKAGHGKLCRTDDQIVRVSSAKAVVSRRCGSVSTLSL